jgi:polyphosphate glucokinase
VQALGIDLGGSGFRIGVYDSRTGDTVQPLRIYDHRASSHPDDVLAHLGEVLAAWGWNGPIGLGFPGAVVNNKICTAPNLGEAWCEVDVEAALASFHGGRFAMLNDADAAAEGERRFGSTHEGHACVLTLTVGTGLGTTVHRKGALEPNLEYGRLEHPSRPGLLEEHLSGRARRERGLDLEAWAVRFQEGLTFLEERVEPSLIVVSGGITEHWSDLAPLFSTRAQLVKATKAEDAGPLGAVAWVASQGRA